MQKSRKYENVWKASKHKAITVKRHNPFNFGISHS